MSPKRTKIFGLDLTFDPKLIVVALVILAAGIYYFTSSSSATDASAGNSRAGTTAPAARPGSNTVLLGRAEAVRRTSALRTDRGALRLVPVDGSRGDVDPTLRIGMLERVKNVPPAAGLRNLFEAGGPVLAQDNNMRQLQKNTPPMIPQPAVGANITPPPPPPPPPFTIPLKYYGFVKPNGQTMDGNRGLFMDGDSILIGSEGDTLEKKFLIVALTPNSARLEDTQAKQGQDLPVTPEAPSSQ